ncbi:MAG: pilus assembly protein PilM [Chromatiales bacterium]|nr:pilus assembly protein PilM [Chromatiales bacterium]
MSWFRSRSANGRRIGLGFEAKGISFVEIDESRGERVIRHCAFHPNEGSESQGQQLAELVKEYQLKGATVNVALDPSMYNLLQVEAPEVEPDELRSALRWRIKDLIDFHIDDAVLDIFDLPESKRQGTPRLMYVVAARVSLIQQLVDQIEEAGLRINAIDIAELATRNLLATIYGPDTVQAMLYLGPNQGSIEITKGDILYLTRRLNLTTASLVGDAVAQEDALDTLVLELQRSLDYYESQYGQGAANSVAVLVPGEHQEKLLQFADTNLLISSHSLPFDDHFAGLDQLNRDDLVNNVSAIGAALRSG